jgi:hypothetical protein
MKKRAKAGTSAGEPSDTPAKRTRKAAVRINGRRVILDVSTEWSDAFLATIGTWDGELERPPQTPITELRDPFDGFDDK